MNGAPQPSHDKTAATSPTVGGGAGGGGGGGRRRPSRGFFVTRRPTRGGGGNPPNSTGSSPTGMEPETSGDELYRRRKRRRGKAHRGGTPQRSPSTSNNGSKNLLVVRSSPGGQPASGPAAHAHSSSVCETDDEDKWRRKRKPRTEDGSKPHHPSTSVAAAAVSSAPPPSTVYVDSHVRWLGEGGAACIKTLKDLLRMGTEHIATEADTPVVGPSQPPSQEGVGGAARAAAAGPPGDGSGSGSGALCHAKSPMLSFTLDGIATPNTYATMGSGVVPALPLMLPPALHSENFYVQLQNNFRPAPPRSDEEGTFDYYTESTDYFYNKFMELAGRASQCLQQESMMACVSAPVYVFGDIHGNFADLSYFLKNIICFNDIHLSPCNILCLGDYVDRGPFSLECVMLLFALKLEAPHKITLLRGNHEDRVVCGDRKTYGNDCFLAQCINVFGSEKGQALFKAVTSAFRYLPLACEIIVPCAPNASLLQKLPSAAATTTAAGGGLETVDSGDVLTCVPGVSHAHAIGNHSWRRQTDQRRQTHTERILCAHGGIPRFNGPPKENDSLAFLRSPKFPKFLTLFPNNPAVKNDPELSSAAAMGLTDEEALRAWYVVFDLLWSDPTTEDTAPSSINEWGFATNSRGSNVVTFSQKAVESFLSAYRYSMLIRAHQEKAHGIRLSKSQKVLTVFSSSNYLGHGNGAGCVVVTQFGDVHLLVKSSS